MLAVWSHISYFIHSLCLKGTVPAWEKKKKEPPAKLGALGALLAQETQEDPGHGKPVSCGDWHSSAGALGTTRPHQGGF